MPPEGRHARLWNWFEGLRKGEKSLPHCEFWPRGGAKSSTAQMGVVRCGERLNRKFVLYVSGTQGQANKSVNAIATKFEDLGYEPAIGRYGNQKGWTVNILRLSNGFNVLAVGLDASAARGVKLDDLRPDLIILDDVDGKHDTPETTTKKIETITETILPAGSSDCAILFIENRIHSNSMASQMDKGTASFLLNREQFPMEPAVYNLKYESFTGSNGITQYRITGGTASWEGQPLELCEAQMNEWGRLAFIRESQHETDEVEDGLWQRERDINPFRYTRAQFERLQVLRKAVAVDPSIGGAGDEVGILCGATAMVNGIKHAFILADESDNATPKVWAQNSVDFYHAQGADAYCYEGNFFKQLVKDLLQDIPDAPPPKPIYVYRGKLIRAEPVQALCEVGRVHFVGNGFADLEKQLCTYKEGDESPGRMDALVILINELLIGKKKETQKAVANIPTVGFDI